MLRTKTLHRVLHRTPKPSSSPASPDEDEEDGLSGQDRSKKLSSEVTVDVDASTILQADEHFRVVAEELTRSGGESMDGHGWDYSAELSGLKTELREMVSRSKKLTDLKLQGARQAQVAMLFLQQQQQQIQAMQQQMSVSFVYIVHITSCI
jgi:hypothetical protein